MIMASRILQKATIMAFSIQAPVKSKQKKFEGDLVINTIMWY